MLGDMKVKNGVDRSIIYGMRCSGAPMREIAEKIGRSKERVRQILARGLGATNHELLSTLRLCNLSGLPRNRIVELYQDGTITPATKWSAGNRDYLLWSPETVTQISAYYQTHRLCKICQNHLPKNRILFCSDKCRQERHKYKYMTPEEKQRVLANIRRYRERRKA
jgi:predicted nucleic acid-binding Zn ribbon protein